METKKNDKVLILNHPLYPELIGEIGMVLRVCSFCYLITFQSYPGLMYEFYEGEIEKVHNGS